jgi:hypothetical protein
VIRSADLSKVPRLARDTKAPDSYKLDDARSILGYDYSQVALIDYDPVELLLCYQPISVIYEVL